MESYRIRRWPDSMPGITRLPVRRALAAMSVSWVTQEWLLREARLDPRELDSLLGALDAQGALERSDEPVTFDGAPRRAGARALLGRVSRRLVDATLSHWSWAGDDAGPPTLPAYEFTVPLPIDTRPMA